MNKIKYYLQRIYRLSLSFKKREEIVWKELKKLHSDAEWKSGIYEKEKYIETIFEISNGKAGTFYYMIYDDSFHCRVKILEEFPSDLTTDLFILASHFNNLLNNGVVVINVNNLYVEYHQKRNLLIPLLYNGEIYDQLNRHFNTSKDIYSAFQRLVLEQEAPAIIIADLLKENEKSGGDAE
ncbi:MAG: hypothetical protein HN522_05325 [Flavobacteriales bacterium]|nr:hypothetical protein [Flavobacteriales bacterium]